LEHRDGHYIVQDWMGAITEISDEYDYTYIRSAKDFVTRKWHRFPVQSRSDWLEKIRWRYDPETPERFPADFEGRCQALQERDYPLRMSFNGPFWQLREWLGMEGLCLLLAEDPAFAAELVAFWGDFVTRMLEKILANITPDFVQVNEDMAYKLHSMISPPMVRRFLLPVWQSWNSLLAESGCPVICVDSDGYIGELLPLFVEAGFNCHFPGEVAAGNDILAYRAEYGTRMAFLGGIDKRALAAGGEVMRAEIMRVVPPLLALGGFIPGCDHGVPPDISWPNFVEYTRLLSELTGWL
jgi:uroporphyrinogen decarboxylase